MFGSLMSCLNYNNEQIQSISRRKTRHVAVAFTYVVAVSLSNSAINQSSSNRLKNWNKTSIHSILVYLLASKWRKVLIFHLLFSVAIVNKPSATFETIDWILCLWNVCASIQWMRTLKKIINSIVCALFSRCVLFQCKYESKKLKWNERNKIKIKPDF